MDFFKFMFYTMGDHIYSYYTFFIIYKSLFKKRSRFIDGLYEAASSMSLRARKSPPLKPLRPQRGPLRAVTLPVRGETTFKNIFK